MTAIGNEHGLCAAAIGHVNDGVAAATLLYKAPRWSGPGGHDGNDAIHDDVVAKSDVDDLRPHHSTAPAARNARRARLGAGRIDQPPKIRIRYINRFRSFNDCFSTARHRRDS